MKKIYKTYLIKKGACKEQLKLFNKHYPKGIHVCVECFKDAQNLGLDVWWLHNFIVDNYDADYFYFHLTTPQQRVLGKPASYTRIVSDRGMEWLVRCLLEV